MPYRTEGRAIMRSAGIILCILSILCVCAPAQRISSQTPAQGKRILIAATAVLNGKGGVLHNTRIAIEGSKIVAIDPQAGAVDYDLRGLTVVPDWVDAHVHITWSFGTNGKNAGGGTAQEEAYAAASNAWVTLMAGFTTVQSVGSPADIPLRNAIAKGMLPGPRILTANETLDGRGEQTGTPDEIRAFVRKQKGAGADLIKIFASGGMRHTRLLPHDGNSHCGGTRIHAIRTSERAQSFGSEPDHGQAFVR
jgi:imidazolonepropionase-like amidohydrolase